MLSKLAQDEWFASMREGVGSSSSNMPFSVLLWEDGYDGGVGMLMLVMTVYDGACIFLIHDGG